MKYTFSLEESDYLTHQLFISSTSKQSLKNRRTSWLLVSGSFAVLAFVMYDRGDTFPAICFAILSVISFIFYPFYSQWKYKKHFSNHIKEHLSNNFGKQVSLEFKEDHIYADDGDNSESRIGFNLIKSVHELPDHYLIRLDSGQSVILPKLKIKELEQLKGDLKTLAETLQMNIIDNTQWRWKRW